MFWEKEYQPSIVGCKLSDEELQEFLKENDIGLQIVDNSTRWCAFAQYYGRNNGLNDIESASFSFMISNFMSFMGVSASTEAYYKEETIELKILDMYNDIQNEECSEEDKVKKLFNRIFLFYRNNIKEYEWMNRRLQLRISESDYVKFQQIPGETLTDKFRRLLRIEEENNLLKIYNICPKINYKDIENFKIETLNVFNEIGYHPDFNKLDWAINEIATNSETSNNSNLADLIIKVYCLLENITNGVYINGE